MQHKQLFWLHIKKSAGTTTRDLLQPYYTEVNRNKKPMTFIQAKPEQYNDILNTYRLPLGDYQFRRSLFAKKYLYPDCWDDIYSFAFSREPIDRCISMFHFLYWRDRGSIKNTIRFVERIISKRKIEFNMSYAFDAFLDYVQEARLSDSIYHPISLRFTTHTAPMWDDITDDDGNVLLTKVFRLEFLTEGVNQVFRECGIDRQISRSQGNLNKSKSIKKFVPSKSQIIKIEKIYSNDFEIYESACR